MEVLMNIRKSPFQIGAEAILIEKRIEKLVCNSDSPAYIEHPGESQEPCFGTIEKRPKHP
jgi:hypothetical protein